MKVSELKRLIKKKGCRFLEHGKEHDVWVNKETGQEAQIPRHNAKETKQERHKGY